MNREPRPLCTRCRRPPAVCYCAELTLLPTKTRVVLLQHPRERDNAIGTAWMASLCLPNSELHVGMRWNQQSAMAAAITNPAAPAVLLYPGADAKDILLDPPQGPVTLVVVDGTWSQAKTLVRDNPLLAGLPRYAFSAPVPSEYRIRKEPSDEVVSTIESLMYALGALEGETEKFTALLKPFRAMVNSQLGFNVGKRARKKKRVAKVVPPSPALLLLRERWPDVVCVVGEVNAWPYQLGRHRDRDELAHWLAVRPSTGEQFVGLATPTVDWSPSTPKNLGLAPARLQTARPRHELYEGFAQFVRPTDIVCGWSWYSPRLFSASQHVIDAPIFNVRVLLEEVLHRRMPRLESYAAELAPLLPGPEGRAGQRLATLVAAVRCCVETPLELGAS